MSYSSQIPEFFWYDLCDTRTSNSFFVDGQDAIVVIRTSLQLTRMRRGPKLRLQRLDGKWRVQVKYPSWEKHSWIQIQIDRIYRVKDGFWGKGPARVWDSAWGLKAVVQAKEQKDLDPDCTWWVLNAKKVGVWVGMSCSDLTDSWFHDTAESMDLGTPTHVIAIPKLLFHKQRGVNGSSNLWGDPLWQFLEKTWDHVGICGNLWYLPQEVDTIGWPVTLRFLLGVWTQSKGCLCEVSWHNSFDILIALTWNSCSSYRFSCILEKNLRDFSFSLEMGGMLVWDGLRRAECGYNHWLLAVTSDLLLHCFSHQSCLACAGAEVFGFPSFAASFCEGLLSH